MSVFDKRQTFPFEVRRYPRMDSLIPPTIPYGVFLGQLHRAYRICSDWYGFLDQSMQVAQRLVTNGCTKQRLVRVYRTFVRQHVRKYSVKAHALCKDFQQSDSRPNSCKSVSKLATERSGSMLAVREEPALSGSVEISKFQQSMTWSKDRCID